MEKDSQKKDNVQGELEELSWSFMLEVEKTNKSEENEEEQREDGEMDFLAPEGDDGGNRRLEVSGDKSDADGAANNFQNSQWDWYTNKKYDYGVNDMGRQSGIIFDEDKLLAHKVTEWHKTKKIRESASSQMFLTLRKIVSWPWRAIYFMAVNFIKGIAGLLWGIISFTYRLIKSILLFGWQFIVAFKHAFVYIFGDFSYLKKGEDEFKVTRIEYAPNEKTSYFRVQKIWKPLMGFAALMFILILPLQIYKFLNKTDEVKNKIAGASESGINYLKEAGQAGISFDLSRADENFILAGNEFDAAEKSFSELGLVTNKIALLWPEAKEGKKLIAVAGKSAEVGQHLLKVASALQKFTSTVAAIEPIAIGDETTKVMGARDEKNNWLAMGREFDLALSKANEANQILATVKLRGTKLEKYDSEVKDLKIKLPELLGWLKNSNEIFKILLYALGTDEPRRLMLVFQNNAELRPTGGFMGSYAIVDIKDGKIKNIEVPGGGFYDLKGSLAVKVDAPYPFHLFSPIWQPWNANWFPDWPASAEKIMWFYDKSGGSSVDGVIGFTPEVLVKLLTITGEIPMSEYGTIITADNFLEQAQMEVEFEYDKTENKPKKFIGDLLPKVLEKLAKTPEDKLLSLWQVAVESLAEKHLLLFLKNEKLQKSVERFGFGGEIVDYSKDYLMVVHTNIAGGKTDRAIKTKIEHQAEMTVEGLIIDTVTITREHTGTAGDVFLGQTNTDYMRVYVPAGSKLLAADGFDGLPVGREYLTMDKVEADPHLSKWEKSLGVDEKSGVRITEEFGKTSFGNWLSVAPGEKKTVVIKYLLPFKYERQIVTETKTSYNFWTLIKQYFTGKKQSADPIKEEFSYNLIMQKQAGSLGDEIVSKFITDSKWQFKNYSPTESIKKVDGGVEFQAELMTDKYYSVKIERR